MCGLITVGQLLSDRHRSLARLIATGSVHVVRAEAETPRIDPSAIAAAAIAQLQAEYAELPTAPREPWRRGRPLR